MPRERSDALGRLVASIDGIIEAHLPQCFLVGVMESPAQVLVIVVDPAANQQAILNAIGEGLSQVLPIDKLLDVLPVKPESPMLKDVRSAGCSIKRDAVGRWWKFW
jgi:hypothetical protein